jgi:hypothetical protein
MSIGIYPIRAIRQLLDFVAEKGYKYCVAMNYPAASYGVSIGNFLNAPRGGELNPCPPPAE